MTQKKLDLFSFKKGFPNHQKNRNLEKLFVKKKKKLKIHH